MSARRLRAIQEESRLPIEEPPQNVLRNRQVCRPVRRTFAKVAQHARIDDSAVKQVSSDRYSARRENLRLEARAADDGDVQRAAAEVEYHRLAADVAAGFTARIADRRGDGSSRNTSFSTCRRADRSGQTSPGERVAVRCR